LELEVFEKINEAFDGVVMRVTFRPRFAKAFAEFAVAETKKEDKRN
jgi:hypothetical protein